MPGVGSTLLFDVGGDRWLLNRVDDELAIRALGAGASTEQEFGFLDSSLLPELSICTLRANLDRDRIAVSSPLSWV